LAAGDTKSSDEGITEVSVYAGDISDFNPPTTEWQLAAQIVDGWAFRRAARLNQDQSDLNKNVSEKESAPVLLRFEDNMVAIISAEKGGALNGSNMIVTEVDCFFQNPFTIAIRGRHLNKVADVYGKDNSMIQVLLDNTEEPNRVKFVGCEGYIDMPVVPTYSCTALSIGALCYFYGINRQGYTELCTRHFITSTIRGFVDLQTPRPDQTPDILLEMQKNKLIISKRQDNTKKERSLVSVWGLEGVGDWIPVVVKHELLAQSLTTIEKFISAKIQDSEDFEPNIVELKLVSVKVVKREVVVLFIESPTYADCRIMLMCNSLEKSVDKEEDDA
jgi:hypothetical protein